MSEVVMGHFKKKLMIHSFPESTLDFWVEIWIAPV